MEAMIADVTLRRAARGDIDPIMTIERQPGFEAFVNAGTSSEYGYVDHAPRESELPEPNSHYAATKAAATLFCGYSARACSWVSQVRWRCARWWRASSTA